MGAIRDFNIGFCSLNYVKLLIVCLIILLSVCSEGGAVEWPDSTERARQHLERGVKLASEGKMSQALLAMNKALELDPYWIVLHYNRAIVYSRLGKKDEEEAGYRQVIALAAQASRRDREQILSASYYNMVFIVLSRGDVDQAFSLLEKALAMAANVNVYYHDLVSDKGLAALRVDGRFVILMRRYWPGYGVTVGRLPVQDRRAPASKTLIKKK